MAVRGTSPVVLSRLGQRYPFLPGLEEVLAGSSPSLRELLESPLYSGARERARTDLKQAATEPSSQSETPATEEVLGETRFLSFQYARLLLTMPGVPAALLRRWCLFTAKSAWADMRQSGLEVPDLIDIARLLGLDARDVGKGKVGFSVPTYIHMATPVREASYRLACQDVSHGIVIVNPTRALRLLQEAVRLHLLSMPQIHLQPAVVELVAQREAGFLEEVSRLTPSSGSLHPGAFEPSLFPPCVLEMQAMMARGENLSHFGRFTLAAFLHRVGADKEYLVDCYRGAPDFDEEITRYQVDHITAHDESKGYTPPECATIRSNGLCFKERDPTRPSICADPTLRHPVNYYYRRKERKPPVPEGTPPSKPDGPERSG
jgi:DNA primase large subunit